MSKKTRLDVLLTERGLCESRQKAQATIMAGLVFVDGQRSDKPGTPVAEDASVEVRGHALRYVSRGGLKLEKAMQTFPITLEGKVCADIGASTGGFTDCMLQNGAAKVYAVDVGYGQLDWKLRSDERVVCLERTNARYLTREQIPEELDFASIDVSFISLKLIFPALYALLRDNPGVLSNYLSIFANSGANILTINQTIPTNGCAGVTISAETGDMSEELDDLMTRAAAADDVLKFEIMAG